MLRGASVQWLRSSPMVHYSPAMVYPNLVNQFPEFFIGPVTTYSQSGEALAWFDRYLGPTK